MSSAEDVHEPAPPLREALPTAKSIPVLCYHGIDASGPVSRFSLSPTAFDRHLDVIGERGLRTITFREVAEAIRAAQIPTDTVVLTFDDGWGDLAREVAPRLAARGLTATAFVPTAYLESRRDGRHIGGAQLRELHDAGFEIGSHGHSHVSLDLASAEQVRHELEISRALLSVRLAHDVDSIAYPYGRSSAKVRDAARAAGYRAGCVANHALASPSNDPLAISRLRIMASTSGDDLANWLDGGVSRGVAGSDRLATRVYRLVRRARQIVGFEAEEGLS